MHDPHSGKPGAGHRQTADSFLAKPYHLAKQASNAERFRLPLSH